MKIAIVDYGAGNLGSVANMLKRLGIDSCLANTSNDILAATNIILPGVGSFDTGMSELNRSGLRSVLDEAVLSRKVPILGICLGMQLMTVGSSEGSMGGLGWLDAKAQKFDFPLGENFKVPHMGWNRVEIANNGDNLNLFSGNRYYFTHSFYVQCNNPQDEVGFTNYGRFRFTSIFRRNNILGVQFHPEKSHRFGMDFFESLRGSFFYE